MANLQTAALLIFTVTERKLVLLFNSIYCIQSTKQAKILKVAGKSVILHTKVAGKSVGILHKVAGKSAGNT